MGPVLVFGHRAPDSDSICSAVAYAHLKNVTDRDTVYLPARLGPAPAETAWVFDRFGLELPDLIEHVRPRACDAMTADAVTVLADENLLAVGRLMRNRGVRALPVVDDDRRVLGLVNQATLADLYTEELEAAGFRDFPMTVGQVARVLGGEVLAGDDAMLLRGRLLIGAMEPETMVHHIVPGDVLIVGDRRRTQPLALEAGVACLIVSGGCVPERPVLDDAAARGAAIIVTSHDSYASARLVHLGRTVSSVMDTSPLLVGGDALLAEVAEDLMESAHREAIVVDGDGRLAGILTRSNLARGLRRRVILVDHNEVAQSAPGIEQAEVIEIVDHHRVGDVETSAPIPFLNLPVGATATIVAERYRELGVEMPEAIAGILLAAILTDTVILRSPTATDLDRETAARLATRVGADVLDFGRDVYRARVAGSVFSATVAVSADVKEYRLGGHVAAVAQVEVVDPRVYLEHADELTCELGALCEKRGLDLAILLVTDVVTEGSYMLASGKTRLAERAFGIDLSAGPVWLDGVLSRKKQVAARLFETLGG